METAIELLRTLFLPDFPSGSAITYYNGNLYLIGDDAKGILVLDENYNRLNTIALFEHPDLRIPKSEKVDFETSTVVTVGGIDYLLIMGSSSRKNRRKGIFFDFNNKIVANNDQHGQEIDFKKFTKRLKSNGIEEVNIEGSTVIGSYFLLSNRANNLNPVNQLIRTSSDFWLHQEDATIVLLNIQNPFIDNKIIGISELCYVRSINLLLLTFASEVTNNAFDDGMIGDSYIGWIKLIDTKLDQASLALDGLANLSNYNQAFKAEKIEGICVESVENNVLTIHLVSDNDQGQSKLFKIALSLS